jgi:unsaturated chondroitin disaccharide hydrolase
LLWLACAHADGERVDTFADAAYGYLDRMIESGDLLDSMFAGMNYLYAGFRGYDVTGDRRLFGVGLTGADAIVKNAHLAARVVPVGEYRIEGPAA